MRFNSQPKRSWPWLLVIAVPVAAFLIAAKTMNTSPPTNIARTSTDAAPELRTRTYAQSVAEVTQSAQQIAGEQTTWLRSWRVGKVADNVIHVEVPVLFFTDDLTIRVDAHEGQTRVNVESHSRVGKGDFGENRRHVAQFLRALDEKLSKSSN